MRLLTFLISARLLSIRHDFTTNQCTSTFCCLQTNCFPILFFAFIRSTYSVILRLFSLTSNLRSLLRYIYVYFYVTFTFTLHLRLLLRYIYVHFYVTFTFTFTLHLHLLSRYIYVHFYVTFTFSFTLRLRSLLSYIYVYFYVMCESIQTASIPLPGKARVFVSR